MRASSQGGRPRLPSQKRTPQSQLAQYERLRELGRGSCGTVWLVRRKADRKLLAMKSVLLPPLACHDEKSIAQRRQALREAEILQMLESTHLVRHIEVVLVPVCTEQPQSELHIVTEYCDGGDLAAYLRKVGAGRGLQEACVWSFASALLNGLSALHTKNILHRDLKPANIFLRRLTSYHARPRSARLGARSRNENDTNTSSEFDVLIGDLGLAREMSSSEPLASTVVGTPLYCAPELFEGQPYGEKADVYSFGVCIFELIHGRPPFAEVQNMGALVRQVLNLDGKSADLRLPMDHHYSSELRKLVSSCLDTVPEKRPNVAELLKLTTAQRDLVSKLTTPLDAPSEHTNINLEQRLVRHSSQPRVALARSPSMQPILERSPSLPVEISKARSPRANLVKFPTRLASLEQGASTGVKSARTPSPKSRFSFRPPQRTNLQPPISARSPKGLVEEVTHAESPAKNRYELCVPCNGKRSTDALSRNRAERSHDQSIGCCVDPVRDAVKSRVDTPVSYELRRSSSAPALHSSKRTSSFENSPQAVSPSEMIVSSCDKHALESIAEKTLKVPPSRVSSDISHRIDVNVEPSAQQGKPIAPEAPKDDASAVPAVSTLHDLEMDFVETVCVEALALGAKDACDPLLPPAGDVFAPRLVAKSPRSVASTPTGDICNKTSRSTCTPRNSLHDVSPRCMGQGSSKAYVAKAQQCFSKWRREKMETRKGEREKVSDSLARSPQAMHHCMKDTLGCLEIRGSAPPRTPVTKRSARGSLAAARLLYTPATRRAKGVRT